MSKKTHAEKHKRVKRTPSEMHQARLAVRRNARKRVRAKRKRPNRIVEQKIDPKVPALFGDPIFMHHVACLIFRYLELLHPVELDIINAVQPEGVDAEFVEPRIKTQEPTQ
jgi:hypothetical protein